MIGSLFKQEKGQALVYVLVVSSIIVAGAYYLRSSMTPEKQMKINSYKSAAEMIKENVMSALDNDAAWFVTVNKNPTLNCLKTPGATCTSANYGTINVYDGDGVLLLGKNANLGFDLSGKPCNTYKTTGDKDCIFQFKVKWSCNGPCSSTSFIPGAIVASGPRVRLEATFAFSPPANQKKLQNLLYTKKDSYTFNFVRGSKSKTLSQYCNSINGLFNQADSTCKSAISRPYYFDCTSVNPHSWFVGFKNDGTPICKLDAKLGSVCGTGAAVTGYAADGSIICGAF